MGLIKFFRGLFTKPKQKRAKALKTKETIKYIGIWERPPVGRLSRQDSERIVHEMAKYLTDKEISKKLNAMGYLTSYGHKWKTNNVHYHRTKKNWKRVTSKYPNLGQRMNYAQQQNGVN